MNGVTTYTVRRLGKMKPNGVTGPLTGTMNAIFKFDGAESEHCVYNELVAVRLAQTLHIPIAAGVLTVAGASHAFASLEVGGPGLFLPDALEVQWPKIAERYPDAVAALVAFDIFIGNEDRARNFKVSLITPHVPLFSGFDHSHALLGSAETTAGSIGKLRGGFLIAKAHPFYGLVSRDLLADWFYRIGKTPDTQVMECCVLGRTIGKVTEEMQKKLGATLNERKKMLKQMIKSYASIIRPT